jgi:hypothetical protein
VNSLRTELVKAGILSHFLGSIRLASNAVFRRRRTSPVFMLLVASRESPQVPHSIQITEIRERHRGMRIWLWLDTFGGISQGGQSGLPPFLAPTRTLTSIADTFTLIGLGALEEGFKGSRSLRASG